MKNKEFRKSGVGQIEKCRYYAVALILILSIIPMLGNNVKGYESHSPIRINRNSDFTEANGVSSGNGTEANPYIIENWDINGTGYGCCIYIGNTTSYFNIVDCYLHHTTGVGSSFYWNSGIVFYNARNGYIENVTSYHNNGHGFYLDRSDYNIFEHCNASENGRAGFSMWYWSDHNFIWNSSAIDNSCGTTTYDGGFSFVVCNNNEIDNCNSDENYNGIKIYEAYRITISNSTIAENTYGAYINLPASHNISVRNSSFEHNTYGYYAYNSRYCSLSGCNISNSTSYGIYLYLSRYFNIDNTTLWNHQSNYLSIYANVKDDANHTISSSNKINGKDVYYIFNLVNLSYANKIAGHFTLAYCGNISLTNITVSRGDSLNLWYTSNSSLDNCTSENNTFGIRLTKVSNTFIEQCSIMNNSFNGIHAESTDNCTVRSCTIKNHKVAPYGLGIRFVGGKNNQIENNNVSFNRVGIHGGYPSFQNNCIQNNNVWNNSIYGINTEHGDSNNVIKENMVAHSPGGGIVLEYINTAPPLNDSVLNNTIIGTNGNNKGYVGIKISNARDGGTQPTPMSNKINISSNSIIDCSYGIMLAYSKNNSIKENTIKNCTNSLYVIYQSANNAIYHNNLYNSAYDSSGFNSWDNGYPSGGNYWSDYNGTDEYCGPGQNLIGWDNIGDTLYDDIDGSANAFDGYPLMRPWPCETRSNRDVIRIKSNDDFDDDHGVSEGNGSSSNPYVIENFIINGTGYGYCIYIGNTTDYFVIRDCYLHNASGGYYYNAGAVLYNVSNGMIDNSTFAYSYNGIYIYGDSDENTIQNNTAILNEYSGIMLVDGCGNNVIIYNTATSNSFVGIHLYDDCDFNTVSYNNASSNLYEGIILSYSDHNFVEGNVVTLNSEVGIVLDESDWNSISENNASSNVYPGLWLTAADNNTIDGNEIWSNGDSAIYLEQFNNNNVILSNTIGTNDCGVYIDPEDNDHNSIYHNDFLDNTVQAYDDGDDNDWDQGNVTGGNYWSDHNCSGNPSDGSEPYTIVGSAYSEDEYPFEIKDGWN
ncbi:MAG: NosD domain-containing protein [Methanobacteriota archaeon]